jgi:hypothetical protein
MILGTFATLGTADGDAFQQMTQIGDYLRDESRGRKQYVCSTGRSSAGAVATTWKLFGTNGEGTKELSDAMKQMQRLEASVPLENPDLCEKMGIMLFHRSLL